MPKTTTTLLKIAKEINISKDTIAEFLVSRGYDIENKPMTKLTDEMINLVNTNYQKEIHAIEKQRQKIQEVKKIQAIISQPTKPTPQAKEDEDDVATVEFVPPPEADKPVHVEPIEEKADVSIPSVSEVLPQDSIVSSASPVVLEADSTVSSNSVQEPAENVATPPEQSPEPAPKRTPRKESKVSVMSAKDVEVAAPPIDSVIKLDANTQKNSRSKTTATTERKKQREETKQSLQKKEEKISIKASSNRGKKTEPADNNRKAEAKLEEDNKKKRRRKSKKSDTPPEPTPTPEVRLIPAKPRPPKAAEIAVVNNKVELPSYALKVLGKIDIYEPKPEAPPSTVEFVSQNPQQHHQTNRTLRSRRKDREPGDRRTVGDNNDKKYFDRNNNNRNYKDFKDNRVNKDSKEHKDFRGKDNNYRDNRTGEYQNRFVDKREPQKFDSDTTDVKSNKPKHATNKLPDRKTSTYNVAPKSDRFQDKVGGYDEKKKKRKTVHDTYSEADLKKVMRATLVEMDDNSTGSKKAKIKLKKKAEREEKEARQQAIIERESKVLKLTEFVTTSDLAALLNVKATDIMLMCFNLGLMVTINQRLDKETIILIVSDYGLEAEFIEESAEDIVPDQPDNEEDLISRPPIITVMGHVDHGKTSLLDYIKRSNVVAGEAGGITQHIGAYHVVLENKKAITFLDTPGHEAFTAMRARGAQVTDIVVIVVAADDNVMPQTIEAISHARAANVPIIVAINKIDKAEANVDKIKQQLSEQGVLVEDWGGKYQCVEISAKKGINIDMLLDKILLESEMLELKANPKRMAQGVVIEAHQKEGLGYVATVVIQNGTLFLRDNFVAGAHHGKVRALLEERSRKVIDVLPAQPATVVGFSGLPEAGDSFVVVASETEAREIAEKRAQLRREQKMRKVRFTTLADLSAQISIGGVKDLNLILKGDMAGSVEALSDSLLKLSTDEVRVNIVLKAAGNISESDVMLAAASNAIMIGFNVSSTPQASRLAEQENVEIRRYNIIYDCINEIHLALEGMLKPDIKEEIAATIEVRQIFKISRIGQIAGCYVSSGKVTRNDKVRIIRDGFPIFNGTIVSLKRNKDDVREVDTNYECGLQIGNFNSFVEGDIIEALRYVEIKRTLDIK